MSIVDALAVDSAKPTSSDVDLYFSVSIGAVISLYALIWAIVGSGLCALVTSVFVCNFLGVSKSWDKLWFYSFIAL